MRRLNAKLAARLAALALTAAIGATMLIATDGVATTPDREYSAAFEAQCVIGPGVFNEAGTVRIATQATGEEAVPVGSQVELRDGSVTITLPESFSNLFRTLGASEVRGTLSTLEVLAQDATPGTFNAAKGLGEAEWPSGLPLKGQVAEGEVTLHAPESGSFGYGPLTATNNAGEALTLTVSSAAGYIENAEQFESTKKGVQLTLAGYKATGERVASEVAVSCTAPTSGATIAQIPLLASSSTSTSCSNFAPESATITAISPNHGPAAGGTSVTISGELESGSMKVLHVFFGSTAVPFVFGPGNSITATAPPGTGTVQVGVQTAEVLPPQCIGGGPIITSSNTLPYTYESIEHATYSSWTLSGSITDKRLGQSFSLPAGATFSGSAQLNSYTGEGSVAGNLSIPPFTANFTLFGLVPAKLSLTLMQSAPLEGTLSRDQAATEDELLQLPTGLRLGVSSIGILGLEIPTSCQTRSPLQLQLQDALSVEALLGTGWSFSGTTAIPGFACSGGFLGRLFGEVLGDLLSGPENPYSLQVSAPA